MHCWTILQTRKSPKIPSNMCKRKKEIQEGTWFKRGLDESVSHSKCSKSSLELYPQVDRVRNWAFAVIAEDSWG